MVLGLRATIEAEVLADFERRITCDHLFAGAQDCLRTISGLGPRVFVATNMALGTTESLMDRVGLREYVAEVVAPAEKPDPHRIRETIARAGLDSGLCWMVGDQEPDKVVARDAGMRFVWFRPGYGDLAGIQAQVIDSHAELVTLVRDTLRDGMPLSAVFFDCNGCLIDSVPTITNAINAARIRRGLTAIKTNVIRANMGHGGGHLIQRTVITDLDEMQALGRLSR